MLTEGLIGHVAVCVDSLASPGLRTPLEPTEAAFGCAARRESRNRLFAWPANVLMQFFLKFFDVVFLPINIEKVDHR
jgi:hypothetical protein